MGRVIWESCLTRQARHLRSFNKSSSSFVCLVQEPQIYNRKLAGQPKNCKRYSIQHNLRTSIYTDSHMQGWFIEALSTRDITVFQTMVNRKSTLLISAYLTISHFLILIFSQMVVKLTSKLVQALLSIDRVLS